MGVRSLTQAVAMFVGLATAARAEPLIYATRNIGSELVAINPATGETKLIGSIGQPDSAPLAFGPDGKLYTVTDTMMEVGAKSQLAVIDPATGKATPIGEPWKKGVRTMALGPGPDGALYAGALVDNMLYRIDPATGQPTEVGNFKGARSVMDFAINPKDGAMYATTTTALYRLDPKTAEMTQVAFYSGVSPNIMGIVFDKDGTLYATNYARQSFLYKIDTATGKGEKVADLPGSNIHSADMLPTP
jgi:DNA-binding beta-propeller fold protein YncE